MAGSVEDGVITLEPVHRFANGLDHRGGYLRWDFDRLFGQVEVGLGKLEGAESVGIDTWGVDYGLLDQEGRLLEPPISYRDGRTTEAASEVHDHLPPERLYAITGTQFLSFNTVYQLAADRRREVWGGVAGVALMPDLVALRLSGTLGTELTAASTTGLLDARTGDWSDEVLGAIGVDRGLFGPLEPPGRRRGRTRWGPDLVTVGSHDTASAVVGVPATEPDFAYIVCGTWSLVGLELDGPVLTPAARAANFTNEIGVDGRTRFLRNVGGLWLLQECLREWEGAELGSLLAAADELASGGPLIDVADPVFIQPDGMPARIAAAAGEDLTPPQTVRCVLESLAAAYAETVRVASRLAEAPVRVIHLVGGGAQNELLCRLTAQAVGLPVIAGPVEATAIGNVAVQARASGALPWSLEDIRAGIAATQSLRRYEPN
jgi:rhamnulokinase